jgi:rhodanese-related sulfurtransferase
MSTLLDAVTRTADGFLVYFSKEIKLLEQSEFRHLLRRFRNSRLIDVSTKEEFTELHIPGSMNFDVLSPMFATKIGMMDKTKAYFLYCRDGSRSETAMHMMQKMGFRRVYSLISGIKSWKGTVATLQTV